MTVERSGVPPRKKFAKAVSPPPKSPPPQDEEVLDGVGEMEGIDWGEDWVDDGGMEQVEQAGGGDESEPVGTVMESRVEEKEKKKEVVEEEEEAKVEV